MSDRRRQLGELLRAKDGDAGCTAGQDIMDAYVERELVRFGAAATDHDAQRRVNRAAEQPRAKQMGGMDRLLERVYRRPPYRRKISTRRRPRSRPPCLSLSGRFSVTLSGSAPQSVERARGNAPV